MATSAAQAALDALATAAGGHQSGAGMVRVPAVSGDARELVFLDRWGWEPCGLVSGASVFHVGVVGWPRGNTEVAQLSNAMYAAREDALSGLRVEAARLGAAGVVNTTLDVDFMADHRHLPRFVATGTAIRPTPGSRSGSHDEPVPFVTTMSAAEMGLLGRSGYRPVGLVMGSCVYHVGRRRVSEWARYVRRNTELAGYSAALYDAREIAMTRLQDEARQLRGGGRGGRNHRGTQPRVGQSRRSSSSPLAPRSVSATTADVASPRMVVPLNDPTVGVEPRSIVQSRQKENTEPDYHAGGSPSPQHADNG